LIAVLFNPKTTASNSTSVVGLTMHNLVTSDTAYFESTLTLYNVLSVLDNKPVLDVLSMSLSTIVTPVKLYVAADESSLLKLSSPLAFDDTASVVHPKAVPAGATPVHNATLFVTELCEALATVCSVLLPITFLSNDTWNPSV
jgi:hypothetical protein